MEKKIILIDMDGVICDYAQKMLDEASEKFGLPKHNAQEDEIGFHTERIFEEKDWKRVEQLSREKGFFQNLEIIEGAEKAIREMSENPNVEIFFCTSPKRGGEHGYSEKFIWLKEKLGVEFADRIMLCRDKTLVHGDYLIDDNPEIKGINKNPSWEHVIFDQPYNRSNTSKKRMDWSNWKEVLGFE